MIGGHKGTLRHLARGVGRARGQTRHAQGHRRHAPEYLRHDVLLGGERARHLGRQMTQTQVVDEFFEQGERKEPGGRNKN